jgi:hypothetical protein
MVMSCHTELSGTVLRTNERGLVLTGRDGWLNISRYADGLVLPPAGTACTVGLDKAGFIRAIVAGGQAPEPSPETGAAFRPASHNVPSMGPTAPERLSARTAALAASIRIVARRSGATEVGEVLAVAAQLEAWLLR